MRELGYIQALPIRAYESISGSITSLTSEAPAKRCSRCQTIHPEIWTRWHLLQAASVPANAPIANSSADRLPLPSDDWYG